MKTTETKTTKPASGTYTVNRVTFSWIYASTLDAYRVRCEADGDDLGWFNTLDESKGYALKHSYSLPR